MVRALGACVLVVVSVSASAGLASPKQASRVIDRTVLCEVGLQGGVRVLNVHAEPRQRPQKKTADVYVTTSIVPTGRIAWVGERVMELSPACKPSRARVPLSRQGLAGFTPSGFYGSEYDCWTPRRVLLRSRVVFKSPERLRSGSPYGFPLLFTSGDAVEASLAIRTEKGKAVALATVNDAGRLRVFLDAKNCFLD